MLGRTVQICGFSGLLAIGFLPARAFAEEPAETTGAHDTAADSRHNTEEPKEAEKPAPVIEPTGVAAEPPAPAVPVAPAAPSVPPVVKPKFGDLSTSGYFRGAFGAAYPAKGRMTCFGLALPGNLHAKYRLGNECEVWAEMHLTAVTYAGDDGSVATLHFMPTVYIPTTYIGYPPTAVINSPLEYTTSTGATLSFPNLYADIKGIHWLFGGTAWAGTRYYKREFVYINDFFYWNPSGVGAGIEDAFRVGEIWKQAPAWIGDLALSYGAFAVDGEPGAPGGAGSPPLPSQTDFGVRNDVQLRGLRPWWGAELQLGFQGIVSYSNDPSSHGGWGITIQYVQKVLGGDNKLAFQYGRGGGTGFGTLARFYYPDFSLRHDPAELRRRVVEVFTIQPVAWYGQQADFIYQHDDLASGTAGISDWYSLGTRVVFGITKHFKAMSEAGYDLVQKANGAPAQWLYKVTGALAISADRGFWSRPELRLFVTEARWDDAARIATIDSGMVYTNTLYLNGWTFGAQAETWW
jgi:maltoporin